MKKTLALSLLFFLALSLVNAVQSTLTPFPEPVRLVVFLLYASKGCLLAAFAALLYVTLKATSPRPPPLSEPRYRAFYDPLLTLRFVAALMVLLGHGFDIFVPFDRNTAIFNGGWQTLLTSSPFAGVWIFLTLSG